MTRDDMPENSELTPRQTEILQLVGEHGYATLETLSQRFDVSVQSIRRDIIQLDKLRLLQRFHGGAGPMDSTVRLGYAEKTMRAAAAKKRIGRLAANLVPDGAAIFLDVGTTVEAVASALKERAIRLHVFTNSLACAMLLTGEPDLHLHVFGGSSRGADGSLVGARTLAEIETIHFDFAFIGFSGFATDGTILDYDLEKIAIKQAAMRRSVQSVLVGDHSKFARKAIATVGSPRDFSHLVTDLAPPDFLLSSFAKAKLEVVEAG
ncbi:DeoR/GlpR transcriptional regulator [Rhizobium sp. Td3]|nr:DeoR/GlpR transcriptional regulator [Rhizobium sp. RM]TMV18334.1 DeoR/GlpR transcriptional regulator [Rhizobium sp. Td3]